MVTVALGGLVINFQRPTESYGKKVLIEMSGAI
jgi:hypothetical protein